MKQSAVTSENTHKMFQLQKQHLIHQEEKKQSTNLGHSKNGKSKEKQKQ